MLMLAYILFKSECPNEFNIENLVGHQPMEGRNDPNRSGLMVLASAEVCHAQLLWF